MRIQYDVSTSSTAYFELLDGNRRRNGGRGIREIAIQLLSINSGPDFTIFTPYLLRGILRHYTGVKALTGGEYTAMDAITGSSWIAGGANNT